MHTKNVNIEYNKSDPKNRLIYIYIYIYIYISFILLCDLHKESVRQKKSAIRNQLNGKNKKRRFN